MRKIGNDEISKLAENYADFWANKDDKQNWMQVRGAFRSGMLKGIRLSQEPNSLEQTEAGGQFLKTSQTKENQQSDDQLLLKHAVMVSICPNCKSDKYNLGYYKKLMICEDCGYSERAK